MPRRPGKHISGLLHSITVEYGHDPNALNCRVFPPNHEQTARAFYHMVAPRHPICDWFYRVKTRPLPPKESQTK